ncbi:S8 family serine peptidase [uncultured Fibrobacter sp.]|uniref:S8 family serine peptidase n=1 Tax=uncultured Fibrobacter sp. TaxID=261512 RepID=UPI0025E97BCE|nr:S8 family serine peptidase [uncultured Fibrobacter sp.]
MKKVFDVWALVCVFFLVYANADDSLRVSLLSERHETEWNWVNYFVRLSNVSDAPIYNPEIRYYAENSWVGYCIDNPTELLCPAILYGNLPKDTMLAAYVDYSAPLSNVVNVKSNSQYTIVKIKFLGLLYPGRTAEAHFRISRKDWTAWSSENDWSFQRNAGKYEPNYYMTVYDSSDSLLWGYDPAAGKKKTDVILWTDQGGNTQVSRYDSTLADSMLSGRFWMLKDIPPSSKEYMLLDSMGVHKLDASAFQDKSLILLKTDSVVSKSRLRSIVGGFYNAFKANDTASRKVPFTEKDLYKMETICDSTESCQNIVSPRDTFALETSCWPDVSMDSCKSIVIACGGVNASIDRSLILSDNTRTSITCLENHSNVNHVSLQQFGSPTNDRGRSSVNIENLQIGTEWTNALAVTTQPTTDWLEGAEYTGEGIIVGVDDTGICYDHSGFYEENQRQKVQRNYGNTESRCNVNPHGTHVAGIIGGNGSNLDKDGNQKFDEDENGNSVNRFKYRGVAPKVLFNDGKELSCYDQIGHVVNHSHVGGYYLNLENSIFYDWKESSDHGDNRSKLEVVAAGNNGGVAPQVGSDYGTDRGYHSIKFDSKNAIVVGNYASYSGKRNNGSSMGPTWDGRIKPDVMAPGSSIQVEHFSQDNVFQMYIDYIRIYDGKTNELKISFDFDKNFSDKPLLPGELAQFEPYVSGWNREVDDGKSVIKLVDDGNRYNQYAVPTGESPDEFYAYWRVDYGTDYTESDVTISKGDVFEISMKKISGDMQGATHLQGWIYVGEGTENRQKFWLPVSNTQDYIPLRVTWNRPSLSAKRIRFGARYELGIISSVPCDENGGSCYDDMAGTSQAAPYVSGIAALMYQRYQKTTGESLEINSMRNSTAKGILIHTAVDMVNKDGYSRERAQDVYVVENKGVTDNKAEHLVKYGEGPDFATGWGKVDGKAALMLLENDEYDDTTKQFKRFREFEIKNGMEQRWKIYVDGNKDKFRISLVWDDAGAIDGYEIGVESKKLINDLDVYLISPSGRYYFPWRLAPLPTESIDENGNLDNDATRASGLENIKESDIKDAVRYCDANDQIKYACFDHLNNVEVIDVDNPEVGYWQIVVLGRSVKKGNNEDQFAQIASLVSDFPLMDSECQMMHPYNPQSTYTCEYNFGDNLENFITFDTRTFAGSGDYFYLYDGNGNSLGVFTGSALAGKRIKTKTKKIKVVLDSDNDGIQGWGFGVSKIEKTPFSILNMLFEATKKK